MGNRFALIISNATYDDAALRKLPSAVEDIAALEPVLHDPDLGDFSVTVVQDQPWNVIVEQLAGFLRWKAPDDLLWVHFSGHGLKDADGDCTLQDAVRVRTSCWARRFPRRSYTRC